MLDINCVLADTVNKIRIAQKYGTCTDKLDDLMCYLSGYQWVYNNAWDCLTDLQKKDVEVFLRSNFNCTSFTMCEDLTDECAATPAPINDDCSEAISAGYPTPDRPTSIVSICTNTYVCGVTDYPTDSGVTLPDNWAVDSSGDVWYTIDTSTSIILQPYIQVYGGTISYPQVAIYDGTCGGLGFVAEGTGNATETTVQPTLDPSTTYYIRISNAGGNANTGTFKLAISLYPVL